MSGCKSFLLACVLLAVAPVLADEEPWRFDGDAIPAPPHQADAWTPPDTELPEALVTATRDLFAAGLADPRGCEYRAIVVATGSVWGGETNVETHGWVLPGGKFAVAWSGVVYPLVAAAGEPADVAADVRALVAADEKERAGKDDFYRFRHAWEEDKSVAATSCLPVKACLLLRLGLEKEARAVWEAWTAGMRAGTNDDAVHLEDPFPMLARDWLWALFDRAVCCHMRGDDRLALASARTLVPMWEAANAAMEKHGFDADYLAFVAPAQRLLADQERRAKARAGKEAKGSGETGEAGEADEQAQRVAAIIRGLDDLFVMQMGQPGSVDVSDSEAVQELVEIGEPAVDALIDCLEHDDRLTRSVEFHRDFIHQRRLIETAEVAYRALTMILRTSSFPDVPGTEGKSPREAAAMRIRAYWNKYKGVPPAERWYRTLRDDEAGPGEWLQAAERIVELSNVVVVSGTRFGSHSIRNRPLAEGEEPAMKGESLRDKADPSVAQLMAKRMEALAAWELPEGKKPWAVAAATRMAVCLSEWDAAAQAAALRGRVDAAFGALPVIAMMEMPDSWNLQSVATHATAVALHLHEAGDKEALPAWAKAIRATDPELVSEVLNPFVAAPGMPEEGLLAPFVRYPDHPALAEAFTWMLTAEESRWRHAETIAKLTGPTMLAMPAFRRRVLELLDDKSAADDEHRECDIVAAALADHLPDAPEFKADAPEADRDKAVAALREALRAWKPAKED